MRFGSVVQVTAVAASAQKAVGSVMLASNSSR
jgi:hypothetical protein